MATNDTCVSIVPYFTAHQNKLDDMKAMCERFIEATKAESDCLYYGFSFHGNELHCREGYVDAEGALAHLDNVETLLKQLLEISDLTRLEIHGPAAELAKLQEPLKSLEPKYYTLEYGFRR